MNIFSTNILLRPRPLIVTILGWLFIVVGGVGLLLAIFSQVTDPRPFSAKFEDNVIVAAVRCVALVAGILMLRGSNLGRWLGISWLIFHVLLSLRHTKFELMVHVVMFILVTALLFSSPAAKYFLQPQPADP